MVVFLLLVVAACACVGALVVLVVAVYASWRYYFTYIPAKVEVEWNGRGYDDTAVAQHRAALYAVDDDGDHPEFGDGDTGRSNVVTYTVNDGPIEVPDRDQFPRQEGLRVARRTAVPVRPLPHASTVFAEDVIEVMEGDEDTMS